MAIIPAHMMRSSAGEYDNEAVAVSRPLVVYLCYVCLVWFTLFFGCFLLNSWSEIWDCGYADVYSTM